MMKYNNKKTKVDDRVFDSEMEAIYYITLKEKKEKGEIKNFICQPKFEIVPSYIRNGKKIRASYYILDFLVEHFNGELEYIDVKGFETDIAKLKRKILEANNPNIRVKWLTRYFGEGADKYGWIEKDVLDEIVKRRRKSIINSIKK